jgi:hypothetical protein
VLLAFLLSRSEEPPSEPEAAGGDETGRSGEPAGPRSTPQA